MTEPGPEQIARMIFDLRRSGDAIDALPEALRPRSRQDGYACQAQLERCNNTPLAGWKIAATSSAGQAHIGVSGPMAGRIFASDILASGAGASLAGNRMRVAEPEFAFRFGHALPARPVRYAMAEILDAVSSLHLALELPNSRFRDFAHVGEPTRIADNACAHMLVLGEATSAQWRSLDLSRHEVFARVGSRYTRAGTGANVLGNPVIALTWIVNELSALGIGLRPGQFVTTGTCTVPLEIEPGDHVRADFGVLGHIEVRIGA